MASTIQNSLYETMSLFSSHLRDSLTISNTIECTIAEVVDPGRGIYKVNHLDKTFNAHSSVNQTYLIGDNVYVLVPENDMTKEKVILSLVQPSTVVRNNDIEDETTMNDFHYVSSNLLTSNSINLHSYRGAESVYIRQNVCNVHLSTFKRYIDNNKLLIFTAKLRTKLPFEQQRGGEYDVSVHIPAYLKEDPSKTCFITIRITSSNLLGNPYRLNSWTTQFKTIEWPEEYDVDVSRNGQAMLTASCSGFKQEASKRDIADIFFKNMELYVGRKLTPEELQGNMLLLTSNTGFIFTNLENKKETKTINANVYMQGNKLSPTPTDEYYWYMEDMNIKVGSTGYDVNGGQGWKCLNECEMVPVDESKPDGEKTAHYIPLENSYSFKEQDFRTTRRIKCIALIGSARYTAIETLQNASDEYRVSITTDRPDNQYAKYTGARVNLTITTAAPINSLASQLKYKFKRYDKHGVLLEPTTIIDGKEVPLEIIRLDGATTRGSDITSNTGATLYTYVQKASFEVIQIEESNSIICEVSDDGGPIGTGAVTVSIGDTSAYATILNGNTLYKYDVNGNSPMSQFYNGLTQSSKKSILPLEYIVRDKGQELNDGEYNTINVTWKVPIDGLVRPVFPKDSTGQEVIVTDEDKKYYILEGKGKNFTLPYTISSMFNNKKADNNKIILEIEYDGKILVDETFIMFLKEGMSGTNGTTYAAVLTLKEGSDYTKWYPYMSPIVGPNDGDMVEKKVKLWYDSHKKVLRIWKNDSYKILNSYKPRFRVRLFKDGEEVNTKDIKSVVFSIYRAEENNAVVTAKQDANTPVECLLQAIDKLPEPSSKDSINIIQAKVKADNDLEIYCYYPLEILITGNSEPYKNVSNTDNSQKYKFDITGGYAEVLYNANGTSPMYDNDLNFKFKWNDDLAPDQTTVQLISGTPNLKVKTPFEIKDRFHSEAREYQIDPKPTFDGYVVSNYIKVTNDAGETPQSTAVRYIRPVIMHYNNYSMPHLNDWDGSRVDVQDGCILAPQVAAGKKESDNSFTGAIMGIKHLTSNDSQETGLFGFNHGTQTFKLNAEDGGATFGRSGKGQIIIDPGKNGNSTIRSADYLVGSTNNTGMCISLADATIHFASTGTGDGVTDTGIINKKKYGRIYSGEHKELKSQVRGFYLSDDGLSIGNNFIVASDGISKILGENSTIGGWHLDDKGHIVSDSAGIIMDAEKSSIILGGGKLGKIYSGQHSTLASTNAGFYLGHDGLSIGSNFVIATDGTASITKGGSSLGKWELDDQGCIVSSDTKGGILLNSSDSTIVLGTKKTDTGTHYGKIYGGKHSTRDSTENGFYLGADGFSVGKYVRISEGGTMYLGDVNTNKKWTVEKGYIAYNATALHFNGTTIDSKATGTGQIYIGTDGIRLGKKFAVNSDGKMVGSDVNLTGTITSKNGSIGGWTIGSDYIKSSSEDGLQEIILQHGAKNSGSYIGHRTRAKATDKWEWDWYVRRDGVAKFANVTIYGKLNSTNRTLIDGTGNLKHQIYKNSAWVTGNWEIKSNGEATFHDVKIKGGSLNIGNKSKINSDGSASFSNVSITGGSLSIGGKASIDSKGAATFKNITISGGELNLGSGKAKITNGGAATFSNITITGGKFNMGGGTTYIDNAGNATFKSITISGGSLNIKNKAKINTDGSASFSSVTITGGSLNLGSGVAKITNTGKATFSNIEIKGGSLTFSGGKIKLESNGTATFKNINVEQGTNSSGSKYFKLLNGALSSRGAEIIEPTITGNGSIEFTIPQVSNRTGSGDVYRSKIQLGYKGSFAGLRIMGYNSADKEYKNAISQFLIGFNGGVPTVQFISPSGSWYYKFLTGTWGKLL